MAQRSGTVQGTAKAPLRTLRVVPKTLPAIGLRASRDSSAGNACVTAWLRWLVLAIILPAAGCASVGDGSPRDGSASHPPVPPPSGGSPAGGEAAADAAGPTTATGGESPSRPVPTSAAPPAASNADRTTRVYPGFVETGFGTEPLALFPAARLTVPPDLSGGPTGAALMQELESIVLDRLPAEIRIVRSRAPVLAFTDWAGEGQAGEHGGFLRSVLDWQGSPGPAGELPAIVGNSVEGLGDSRGIRYFLFPRAVTVLRRGTFDYFATVEALLLDARGERVVWAGTGSAAGTVPPGGADQLLAGIVRDAVTQAVSDLAVKLPGAGGADERGGFTDVDSGRREETR